MEEVRRIGIKASMDADDEPLNVYDGDERIDLVCEECGYEERGSSRGIDVSVFQEDDEIEDEEE